MEYGNASTREMECIWHVARSERCKPLVKTATSRIGTCDAAAFSVGPLTSSQLAICRSRGEVAMLESANGSRLCPSVAQFRRKCPASIKNSSIVGERSGGEERNHGSKICLSQAWPRRIFKARVDNVARVKFLVHKFHCGSINFGRSTSRN